jgi:hypothetical protein
MVQKYIFSIVLPVVVGFALRQAHKYGAETDWDKVKADVHPRVEALIPGVMFDHIADGFVDRVIDACAEFLKGDALDTIAEHLVKSEFAEAFADLLTFVKEKVGL